MNTKKIYSRAPLVEAVLAIQFEDCGLTMDKLAKCGVKVKKEYPKQKTLQVNTSSFEFGQRSSASASSELVGYSWTSADEKRVFQAKVNGFAFSMLSPYTSWQNFNSEAKVVWDVYRKAVQRTMNYSRVALRYINRFDIPLPFIEVSDYFNIYANVPSDLPQGMESFFFQVAIGFPENKASVNVIQTQTKCPPDKPMHTSIIFDIDVVKIVDIPTGDQLWTVFEELAALKTRVFESSITDKAREVIE